MSDLPEPAPAPPERSETKKPCAEDAENEARMQRINQATEAAAEIVAGLPYTWLGGGDSGQRAVRYVDSDAARRMLALAYIAEAEARAAERAGESREAEPRLSEISARAARLAERAWPDDKPGKALSRELLAHLLEEAGELAGASRSFFGRSLKPEATASLEDVTEEHGDVGVIWLRLAHCLGVDPVRSLTVALDKFERYVERAALAARAQEPTS